MTTIILFIFIIILTALYSYKMGEVNTQKKFYDLELKKYTPTTSTAKKIEKR